LMGGYAHFNSMNQTLVRTGALEKNAASRLAATGRWVTEATQPGGLQRFGAGFIATVRVRMVHAMVRRALEKQPTWDAHAWGRPINQVDLYATYLAFGPVTLAGARLFGVLPTRRDVHAVLHMWRYIGWLSGVDDEWLVSSEGDGLRKLYHASLTHRRPDEKVGMLGRALRDEPFTRRLPKLAQHPHLQRLVRWFLYHKHMSNSALTLSPWQKRRLGLPLWTVPWYPLLTAPFRFLWLTWHRVRGGYALQRLLTRYAVKQQELLASYATDEPAYERKP